MNFTKLFTIGFILSSILFACGQDSISKHLSLLQKENSKIKLTGWSVKQEHSSDIEEYYCLIKQERDTFHLLTFSYFPNVKKYKLEDYIESYVDRGVYHELSLLNNDTLYYYTAKKNSNSLKNDELVKIDELDFKLGWYYYLYTHGKYNWEQKEYFESNRDSLVQIKGTNLPQLPKLNNGKNK